MASPGGLSRYPHLPLPPPPPGLGDTPRVRALIDATARPLPPLDGVAPTTLYPLRNDVGKLNDEMLHTLDRTTAKTYQAK